MASTRKESVLSSLNDSVVLRRIIPIFFIVVFAIIGTVILVATRAATPTNSFELESGARSGNVSVISNGAASGGSAIQFGSVSGQSGTTRFGMSSPDDKWDERLAQVGGKTNIKYRRIFYTTLSQTNFSKVQESISDGMVPVISWKLSPYTWAEVSAGAADGALQSIVTRLNAIPGKKHLVLHHEPASDGTAAEYVAMQLRALPILKTATNVTVGPIANGWWWSAKSQGYTDTEINQWLPDSLINISDVIASDTYQDEALNEDGSVKAQRMAAWAKRKGNVKALGIGEFNGWEASAITNVMNVVKAEPLFSWALVWNSGPTGLGIPLDGDRLEAFKQGILTNNITSVGL